MKTLLITGGSGFLGKQLATRLMSEFSRIIIVSRNGEFLINDPLWNDKHEIVSVDISDEAGVNHVFEQYKPNYIIHAAAVKSIHAAEQNLSECIKTNIIGSENIARAAVRYGCEKVIALSTLRATPPVSGVYGMSKAFMEKLCWSYGSKGSTKFINIRLGNIAGSPDSVLKIWKRMLDKGGVIKTTGFAMSRYFMGVDEMESSVRVALWKLKEMATLTLVPVLKLVRIETLLHKFIKKFGGKYEVVQADVVERTNDYLIGEEERPFAKKLMLNEHLFFSITPGRQTHILTKEELDLNSNQYMSDSELDVMITNYD